MRDPKRIDAFCSDLAKLWHKVPDWRFGQFLSNVLDSYNGDIFFPEDDKLLQFMKDYFKQENSSPYYGVDK